MQTIRNTQKIPKIIHQTYKSDELPHEIQNIINKLKQLNSGWEYRFYNDADITSYIKENYDETYLDYYEKINPKYGAARADFFRYLLLYNEGGVYLDIKSFCNIPLDDLITENDTFFISQWQNQKGQIVEKSGLCKELSHIEGGEFQQWYIITEPKSPFLECVIENMINNIKNYSPWRFGIGKKGVLRLTGPIMYTLAISPLLNQFPHKFSRYDYQFGLEYSKLPKDSHETILPGHYSLVKEPVIITQGYRAAIHKIYIFLYLFYRTKLRINKRTLINKFFNKKNKPTNSLKV
jgi:mannosyltransferase OCH1-like enzyme